MDERTEQILNDPAFRTLLSRRSRLRWGMAGILIVAYLSYMLAGVWYPDAMAQPFFGTSMSWIMALAYLIMFLSVVTSVLYVRIIGKLHSRNAK